MPTSNVSDAEWDRHQREIWTLYLYENKSLEEVMKHMESKYKFAPSSRQWTSKLEQWKFYKSLDRDGYCYINNQEKKRERKRAQKRAHTPEELIVVHAGVQMSKEEVRKKMAYHCRPTLKRRGCERSPTPPSPKRRLLQVYTPPPLTCIPWPNNLPWFGFHDQLQDIIVDIGQLPQEFASVLQPFFQKLGNNSPPESALIPTPKTPHLARLSPARIHHLLSCFMPEKRSGEHLARAASICQHGSQWALTTAVEILLYTHSNNLLDPFADELRTYNDDKSRNYYDGDSRFLALIESFITIEPLIDMLKASQTRTAMALLDRVFASAVRQGRTDVLKALISKGFEVASRVNKRIADSVGGRGVLPINVALGIGNTHLVEILLEQGATFTYYSPGSADTEDPYHCSLLCAMLGDAPYIKAPLINMVLTMQKSISEEELLLSLDISDEFTYFGDVLPMIWKRVRELKQDAKLKEPLCVLILAIRYEHTDIVKELVPKIKDLDAVCNLDIRWHTPNDEGWNPTALMEAAACGCLETCKMLLDAGAKPDPGPASGCSALWIAAKCGHEDVVSLLCAYGADINRKVSHRSSTETALSASIDNADALVANVLLKLGAKSSADDLALAVRKPNIELARGLVESGTEISHKVMLAAAKGGSTEMIDLLTEGGAMWHRRNTWGESPLVTAILFGCDTLVTRILEARPLQYDPAALLAATYASVQAWDTSTFSTVLRRRRGAPRDSWDQFLEGIALIIAVVYGDEATLALLLASGFVLPQRFPMATERSYFNLFKRIGRNLYLNALPRYDSPDYRLSLRHGMSLLGVAAMKRQSRMIDFLLQRGYYPNAKDLSAAAADATKGIMECLLKEIQGDLHQVPLESALLPAFIRRGWRSLVEKILGDGVDVNTKGDFSSQDAPSMTSLQAAAWIEDFELVGKLIKRGARVNDPASFDRGATALQYAALRGSIGIAKLLVESGANCNAPGAELDGRTALEGAAEHGHIDMLQYLLDSGADTEGEHRGAYVRAIKRAELECQHTAVELLRSHRFWTREDHQIYSRELPSDRWHPRYEYENETDSEDDEGVSSGRGSTTFNEGGVWDHDVEAEEPADHQHHQDNSRRGAQRASVTNSQEFLPVDLSPTEGMQSRQSAPGLETLSRPQDGWHATADAQDDEPWAPQEFSLSHYDNVWGFYADAAERLDEPLLVNADRGLNLASSAERAQMTTGTEAGQDSMFWDAEGREGSMVGDAGGLGDLMLGDAGGLEDSMDGSARGLRNLMFGDAGGLEDFWVGDAGGLRGPMLWDQGWDEFLG